jgi:hypothetical protein
MGQKPYHYAFKEPGNRLQGIESACFQGSLNVYKFGLCVTIFLTSKDFALDEIQYNDDIYYQLFSLNSC